MIAGTDLVVRPEYCPNRAHVLLVPQGPHGRGWGEAGLCSVRYIVDEPSRMLTMDDSSTFARKRSGWSGSPKNWASRLVSLASDAAGNSRGRPEIESAETPRWTACCSESASRPTPGSRSTRPATTPDSGSWPPGARTSRWAPRGTQTAGRAGQRAFFGGRRTRAGRGMGRTQLQAQPA